MSVRLCNVLSPARLRLRATRHVEAKSLTVGWTSVDSNRPGIADRPSIATERVSVLLNHFSIVINPTPKRITIERNLACCSRSSTFSHVDHEIFPSESWTCTVISKTASVASGRRDGNLITSPEGLGALARPSRGTQCFYA